MLIPIEIDTSDLTRNTSRDQDRKLGNMFINLADDDTVAQEAYDRNLVEEIIDKMNESERERLFNLYGYERITEK